MATHVKNTLWLDDMAYRRHVYHKVTVSHGISDKNTVLFAFETVILCGLCDIKLINISLILVVSISCTAH